MSRATGICLKTIRSGIIELESALTKEVSSKNQRKPGAGRKKLTEKYPGLTKALDRLLVPYTSGDPMRPLSWTCKSTAKLSDELAKQGFQISADSLGRLLKEQGYSLQSNRKGFEGAQHLDRNSQFEYINSSVETFQARGCPVISVDTKKKNLLATIRMQGKNEHLKVSQLR